MTSLIPNKGHIVLKIPNYKWNKEYQGQQKRAVIMNIFQPVSFFHLGPPEEDLHPVEQNQQGEAMRIQAPQQPMRSSHPKLVFD